MLTRHEAEAKFVEELPRIERIIGALCRRHGLRGDEADDIASWVKLRLVEDDYAILRKWRGDSALATYLTVAIAMLFRDHRVQEWGRWRPSAEARRRGTLAMRLELLVHRDGLPLAQAAEQLRSERVTDLSDRALAALLAALPAREPLRPHAVDADVVDAMPGASSADDGVRQAEAAALRTAADAAIEGALAQLPGEDRLLVRLRFWDGLSLADVARALALPQKPLYRRLERLLAQLRARLGESGISAEQVRELLNLDVDTRAPDEPDNPETRPSNVVMSHPGARR